MYFFNLVPSTIADPERDMRSTVEAVFDSGLQPGNVVFEMAEPELANNPAHSRRIREYLRRNGFGFALSSAGLGPGAYSFRAVSDLGPEYIKLDSRLNQNNDRPTCAATIGKLVEMADRSGARLVAEGVDRARMAENLWLLGVQFMQGHLFGDPTLAIRAIRAATLEFAP